MIASWKDLSPGPNPPDIVYAFIEIPKGSNVKYEIDHETGVLCVDRVLPTAFNYPFDYGIIPQTWYYDQDPMDIMVLSRTNVVPCCVMPARPVGFLRMSDEAGIDNKILAVPAKDPHYDKICNVSDLSPGILSEIRHFLEHYKDLEKEKWVRVESWDNSDVAKEEIIKAIEMFKNKK